jgi:hypothetical protein
LRNKATANQPTISIGLSGSPVDYDNDSKAADAINAALGAEGAGCQSGAI